MTNKEIENIYKKLEYIEPETVRKFRGEETPSLTVLKDMTNKLIENTDAPFQDFYVFENVIHVLNNIEPNVDELEGVLPEHIWYCLMKMKEITGEDFDLSHEIKKYIQFIHEQAGIIFLPPFYENNKKENLIKVQKLFKEKETLIESDEDIIENQAIKLAKILHYVENFKLEG